MRLVLLALTATSLASSPVMAAQEQTEEMAEKHQRHLDQLKFDADPRGKHRQRLLAEHKRHLAEKGIKLNKEYEKLRKLHSVEEVAADSKRRLLQRTTSQRNSDNVRGEDKGFWVRLMQGDGSLSAVPVAIPVAIPTGAPVKTTVPAPATVRPAPSVVPVATEIPSPVMAPSPENAVEAYIRSIALFGGVEFDDPQSYQSQSLNWLAYNSTTEGLDNMRLAQRYGLGCIYFATFQVDTIFTDDMYGPGETPPWKTSTNWVTNENECTWARIECDENNAVATIDLFSNDVTGEFPPEVVYMAASLAVLDLGSNVVTSVGEKFNPYLALLNELRDLRTDSTNFISTDGIPVAIAAMKNLGYYACDGSLYRGPLNPDALPSDLTRLSVLDIEGNDYGSTIPDGIGLLPALQNFYIRSSAVSGTIDFMVNFQNIFQTFVDDNPGLGGTLAQDLGNLSTLVSFSVTGCSFVGSLPASMGNIQGMISLYFDNNSFTGGVPSEWGQLTAMTDLQVQRTDLSITIPESVCNLRSGNLTSLIADCDICPEGCCTDCL